MSKYPNETNHWLSELFHYDPSTKKYAELRKGLLELRFLLTVADQVIYYFQENAYEKFDSLVGENACQIRAIKIAIMANYSNSDRLNNLRITIAHKLEKLAPLLKPSITNTIMHKGLSLKDITEANNLDIAFSSDELFLIQSYLLTEMKECQSDGDFLQSILRKERCSPSILQKKHPEISYSFVEKLAKKLRPTLSETSVNFVRKIALELEDQVLIKMVSKDFEKTHNNLTCIPTFWSFKTLFSMIHKKNVPLVFHIKFLKKLTESSFQVIEEETLHYKVCREKKVYIPTKPDSEDLIKPACIIQGVLYHEKESLTRSKHEWKKLFNEHSVIDMILSMGADHRQYPNPDQQISVQDPEYIFYKTFAEQNGLAFHNPTRFFVQHIYCAQPSKVISSLGKYKGS